MKIQVIVHPKQKRPRVEKRDGDAKRPGRHAERGGVFHVYVAALAQDGKANRAVIDSLAGHFEVPSFEVELKIGHTGKIKIFEIHDV